MNLVLGAGDLDLDYYGFIVSSLNKPSCLSLEIIILRGSVNTKGSFPGTTMNLKYEREINKPTYGATYIGGKGCNDGGVIFCWPRGHKTLQPGDKSVHGVWNVLFYS